MPCRVGLHVALAKPAARNAALPALCAVAPFLGFCVLVPAFRSGFSETEPRPGRPRDSTVHCTYVIRLSEWSDV